MDSLPDYRRKTVVTIRHRREPRAFHVLAYGIRPAELTRGAIISRLERRGFSYADWSPDWDTIHVERSHAKNPEGNISMYRR